MTQDAPLPADYGAALRDAFRAFTSRENVVPLIVGAVVLALGSITLVLAPPLALGYVALCLKIARGEPVTTVDLWSGFSRFAPALVMGLLAGVAILIGLVLLVLPGLALAVLFSFSFHVMASEPELSPVDALKRSIDLAKSNLVDVLVVWVVGGVLNALLSVVVVGPILGAAYTALLSAFVFHRITSPSKASPAP